MVCSDLGEFIRFYPQGKYIVRNLATQPLPSPNGGGGGGYASESSGGDSTSSGTSSHSAKAMLMRLLKHDDDSVQKAALACVSRLMVSNWAFLEQSNAEDGK